MKPSTALRSTCGICHVGCGVRVLMNGSKVVKVEGDKEHPLNRGALCPKGAASLEYLYQPRRIRRPLKRIGKKGGGNWEVIGWDEAIALVSKRLGSLRDKYGAESVAFIRGSAKGLQDDYLVRFANVFGSPNFLSASYVCFIPRKNASLFTYGFYAVPDLDHPPAAIVVWGENVSETLHYNFSRIRRAQKGGTKLIVVDPLRTEAARVADLWMRLKPGSDLALALGLLNVVLEESLYDRRFVETETVGFEELKRHVEAYTPERVAQLTSLDEDAIRNMARTYAGSRPAVIEWGNGIDQDEHNFQTARALCILRSVCGNMEVAGGELKCVEVPILQRGSAEMNLHYLVPPNVRSRRIIGRERMLPNVFYALQGPVFDAMLTGVPYPVRGAFVQGSNPLLTYPHARKVAEALLSLEFMVVADMFMTPTAAIADVVLPAATYLESDSIAAPPYAMPVISVQQKTTSIDECRSDYATLSAIAGALGQGEHFWKTEEECLDFILRPAGLAFRDLRERSFIEGTRLYESYRNTGFATPSKKVELYSAQLKSWGFDPLPEYRPTSDAPCEGSSGTSALLFTSWKHAPFRHSGGRQIESLRARHPEPVVLVHPDTARVAGIGNGEPLIVRTAQGSIIQKASYSVDIDPGVIAIDHGWWFPENTEDYLFSWDRANTNILTDDAGPCGREMGTPRLRGIPCTIANMDDDS
jgi:anaerobic selenocysteine-containing dehydrogenase